MPVWSSGFGVDQLWRRAPLARTCGAFAILTASVACAKQAPERGAESAAATSSATAVPVTSAPPVASPDSNAATTPAVPSKPPLPAVASDTLRGTVQRVGNDPVSVLVLRTTTAGSATTYALRGAQRELQQVTGLEIVVRGTLTSERDVQAAPRGALVFEVRQFEVRAADGVAAVDGIVHADGGAYSLVTLAGQRLSTPNLPAELRNQVGARVFVVGPLKEAAAAYGIIAPKP